MSVRRARRTGTPIQILASLVCLLMISTPRSDAAAVKVPVHLDYPLVQALLVSQLFAGPEQSRELLNDPTGCSEVTLSEPRVTTLEDTLRLVAAVQARLGQGSQGNCTTLVDWRGRVDLQGRPVLDDNGRQVRLEPRQIRLYDAEGNETPLPLLQRAMDSSLRAVVGNFRIDLTPTIESLGVLLPEFLPGRAPDDLRSVVGSLRIDGITVSPDTLDVLLAFAVEPLVVAGPERALSEEELLQWEQRWQMMDAMLVMAVKQYAASTRLQALRSALLDVLIESRYRLRDALSAPVSGGNDPVRAWFLDSWQQLAPIVRDIALEQPDQAHMACITVITAADALEALDQLGPYFGLEISVAGLRRLARLINAGAADDALRYSEEVDPELQRLMEERFEAGKDKPLGWRLDLSPFPRVVAAPLDRLNSWAPSRDELPAYLPLVADLLDDTSSRLLQRRRLDAPQRQVFRKLVLATAWQESCWRQYVVERGKLVPLRSTSGDVGMMQVNERVWRGFYNLQQLRWDIGYNTASGAEVLLDYLVKYAVQKAEHRHPGGLANLARASYSAYNGGPSKLSRYRRSDVSADEKMVDAAFWEKYRQVDAGNEFAVAACLGGKTDGRTRAAGAATAMKPTAGTPARSTDWLTGQNPAHYTLQLGAFSREEFARNFLRRESPGPEARIHRHDVSGEVRFLVLYGAYPDRRTADSAAATLARFKPWVRRIGDLK